MNTLRTFFTSDGTVRSYIRIGIAGLGALLVGAVVLRVVGVALFGTTASYTSVARPSMIANDMFGGSSGGMGFATRASSMEMSADSTMAPLMAPMPTDMYAAVNGSRNAEKYERFGYAVGYHTRRFSETCAGVEALKPLAYVVFDSANKGEYFCTYSFRVEKDKVDTVLATLKTLDPDTWNENIQSVAQTIEDTEDAHVLLQQRLASIQDTLTMVERAYNNAIARVAVSDHPEALAELVTAKLSAVERLTNEKISLTEQIARMQGGKDDQLDDVAYAHIDVSVSEVVYVDWNGVGSVWRERLQTTVREVNETLAYIVLALPAFILSLISYALLVSLVVIAVTYVARILWAIVRRVWSL